MYGQYCSQKILVIGCKHCVRNEIPPCDLFVKEAQPVQDIIIILACSQWKDLSTEDTTYLDYRTWEINLKLNWKHFLCLLDFIVLEGVLQADRGKKTSVVLPNVEPCPWYNNGLPRKLCPPIQEWFDTYEVTNYFLIRSDPHSRGQISCLICP